jgi:hypothetical protein
MAFSRVLKKTSEVGNHPTNNKSAKANSRNRLHRWGFLRLRNNKLSATKPMTQLSGSMQNCTSFEKTKNNVSISYQSL